MSHQLKDLRAQGMGTTGAGMQNILVNTEARLGGHNSTLFPSLHFGEIPVAVLK